MTQDHHRTEWTGHCPLGAFASTLSVPLSDPSIILSAYPIFSSSHHLLLSLSSILILSRFLVFLLHILILILRLLIVSVFFLRLSPSTLSPVFPSYLHPFLQCSSHVRSGTILKVWRDMFFTILPAVTNCHNFLAGRPSHEAWRTYGRPPTSLRLSQSTFNIFLSQLVSHHFFTFSPTKWPIFIFHSFLLLILSIILLFPAFYFLNIFLPCYMSSTIV